MKILRLKALNINSLKGTTQIDFTTLLNESSLFAITGPTGSGKSTILDIISCALYGRTARLSSPPNDLMSRYTGEAFCEVEFELKGVVYRSSWSQKRARKKYDGNFQSANMELSILHRGEEKGDIITDGVKKVPKKIESITGLDFSRFTQSMMLVQGSFDAFLKANESERSVLLEQMTGTQIYTEISTKIYERYTTQKQAIEIEKKTLENIVFLTPEILKEKSEQIIIDKTSLLDAKSKLRETAESLHWLERFYTLTQENQIHQANFLQIDTEKNNHQDDFKRLEEADRALNIAPLFHEKKLTQKHFNEHQESIILLSSKIEHLDNEIILAQANTLIEVQKVQEAEALWERQSYAIKEAREIQIYERELKKTLPLHIDTTQLDKDSLEESLVTLTFTSQKQNEIYQNLLEKSAEDADKEVKNDKLIKLLEQLIVHFITYQSTQKELYTLQENLNILQQKEYHSLIVSLKEHIKTLSITKEQAIVIRSLKAQRAKLIEGEACGLCGATHHPYAIRTPNVQIDEISVLIEAQESQLREIEKAQTTTQTEIKNLQEKREESQVILSNLLKIFEKHKLAIERLTIEKLEIPLNKCLTKKAKIKQRREEKERLGQKKEEIEKKLTHQNRLLDALNIEEQLRLLAQKREAILTVEDIDGYEKNLKHNLEKCQKESQDSQQKQQTLLTQKEETKRQRESLNNKTSTLSKRVKLLEEESIEALKIFNFQDEVLFYQALLETATKESLQQKCQKILTQWDKTKTLKLQTQKALIAHQETPKTTQPKAELLEVKKETESTIEILQQTIGGYQKEIELDKQNQANHKTQKASLREKQKAFDVWTKLNQLIGSSDGKKFSKFAQGITLDQLIILANRHLEILSSRYILVRSQKDLLEIDVIDTYQGNSSRSVSTLSGGESFIVSLALALGLSELASQKIAIDSLFMDEGFGTLDEESLETALNALNLLQNRGKMVGIISHVEALKEKIPIEIKVVPHGDGTSSVK